MKKLTHILLVILRYLLAIFMINAGLQHFLTPEFYLAFVPRFLPFTEFFVFFSGVIEIILGILLIFNFQLFGKSISAWAALAIFFMFWIYLPIHISDVFMENPAIGTHKLALIRVPFQFLFIAWAWIIWKFLQPKENIKKQTKNCG
ncbi:putative membrane protein [Bisgaardia hudsonensis]|uniref:Putative membrane protein n=1 Tax=Bisgaardia hudsonensis TaxID=109472 RepID=A0A4R2N364_9PAST|nr:DoxX family membrane protein [Bisgaardia hudsonensis]QLB12704.1 hypothetical protein A6A11_03330 [Bisgaardia hudsonensis]TCP14252.1 putative membrane protein [Bisgaardia hudsonensis]